MKKIITDSKKTQDILTRGVEEIIEKEGLQKKLKSGQKLRIKFGIDPTGPKIHLGRAIQFWKLRAFQDLGHQVVLIFGDFTAQIGDASDKTAMRRPLTEKEIKNNLKDYQKQISKILDLSQIELHYNSEWLKKLSGRDLLDLAMHFTAQQMIQRRNFKERWEQGKPIGVHELSYPLLQGYDSVAIKADVEIGGSDQLFNLKVGREIQRIFGQSPQDIMTLKMLNGLDGRKMSTSWGNVINVFDAPEEMYGKIMSMKDELMPEYFELCTSLPLAEIEQIKQENRNNPRDLKACLAREIVSRYYGFEIAEKAKKEFNRIFQDKQTPSQMPIIELEPGEYSLLDLLVQTKMASSKSEAKRLVEQKAVEIDEQIVAGWQQKINLEKSAILKVGKRKFVKLFLRN